MPGQRSKARSAVRRWTRSPAIRAKHRLNPVFGRIRVFLAVATVGACVLLSAPRGWAKAADGSAKARKKDKPKFKWGARIMSSGGWRWRPRQVNKDDRYRGKFEIRQARLRVGAKQGRWRLNVSAEFADGLRTETERRLRYIRNAYAEYRPSKLVRLRVGVFKRPYSQLALSGAPTTLTISRGLTYRYAIRNRVRQLSYGMRAPGVMMRNRFKSKLGKTNLYTSLSMPGKDLRDVAATFMVSQDLGKVVHADLFSTYKRSHRNKGYVSSNASGLSLGVDYRGLAFLTELHVMQNWRDEDVPWGLGALGMLYYGASVGESSQIGPVVSAEWLDRDLRYQQSEAMRVAGGVHARVGSRLRFWLEGEWLAPLTNSDPEDVEVEKQLFLRLQMSLSM